MTLQSTMIQGTAKEIKAALADMPEDEIVRLVVGRPSLTNIAKKIQAEAARNGMTADIHDALLASLKTDR